MEEYLTSPILSFSSSFLFLSSTSIHSNPDNSHPTNLFTDPQLSVLPIQAQYPSFLDQSIVSSIKSSWIFQPICHPPISIQPIGLGIQPVIQPTQWSPFRKPSLPSLALSTETRSPQRTPLIRHLPPSPMTLPTKPTRPHLLSPRLSPRPRTPSRRQSLDTLHVPTAMATSPPTTQHARGLAKSPATRTPPPLMTTRPPTAPRGPVGPPASRTPLTAPRGLVNPPTARTPPPVVVTRPLALPRAMAAM
ncbi:hypothetical protein V8F06_002766 [Rhypophila decipiens]